MKEILGTLDEAVEFHNMLRIPLPSYFFINYENKDRSFLFDYLPAEEHDVTDGHRRDRRV